MAENEQLWYTLEKVAERLDKSVQWVEAFIEKEQIPHKTAKGQKLIQRFHARKLEARFNADDRMERIIKERFVRDEPVG